MISYFRRDDGVLAQLEPVPWPDEFDWYAEGPDQRPPQFYELLAPATGEVLDYEVVYPYEPWSPFEAILDKLQRQGWTYLPTEDEVREASELCEHGLSARLCAGPEHYPIEL